MHLDKLPMVVHILFKNLLARQRFLLGPVLLALSKATHSLNRAFINTMPCCLDILTDMYCDFTLHLDQISLPFDPALYTSFVINMKPWCCMLRTAGEQAPLDQLITAFLQSWKRLQEGSLKEVISFLCFCMVSYFILLCQQERVAYREIF